MFKNLKNDVDWPVFLISGGALVLFVLVSIFNMQWVSVFVNNTFSLSITYFGAYWQVLLPATFIAGAIISCSRYGKLRVGNISKPNISFFRWSSIIIVSGLGAGGVFWAAAEPMYYFSDVPPMFGNIQGGTEAAVGPALSQSFMSWGFTAWALYGAISAIIIMYAHYHKGLSLKPRLLLYPILGDKVEYSKWGTMTDVFCILGAVAGTIGTVGFFGFQFSYWLNSVFGLPDNLGTQILAVAGLMTIVVISTVSGLDKGIQLLSRANVWFAITVGLFILIIGPGGFVINSFISSYGTYLSEFITISTYRGDNQWLGAWMLFFFGWFIGFGPLMAILVARISQGRSIREIFFVVSIVTAVASHVWFTILGGSGIFYELANPNSISEPLANNGLPAAVIALASQMPLGGVMMIVFLILTITFVITTADSMSYSISMAVTGSGTPSKIIRVFWAVIIGSIAVILINIGEGSISALQSFIVVTAVPISIIMLPSIWSIYKLAKILAKEDEQQENIDIEEKGPISKKM